MNLENYLHGWFSLKDAKLNRNHIKYKDMHNQVVNVTFYSNNYEDADQYKFDDKEYVGLIKV